jgi:hypothetical protein
VPKIPESVLLDKLRTRLTKTLLDHLDTTGENKRALALRAGLSKNYITTTLSDHGTLPIHTLLLLLTCSGAKITIGVKTAVKIDMINLEQEENNE